MTALVLNLAFERRRLHAMKRGELIWFVLADVCAILGIEQPTKVANRLDDDQKGMTTIHTLGGGQQMLIVSEDAVYEIACTSRKPVAKRFSRWLYREVLPEIRRTGSYHGGSAPLDALVASLQTELDLEPNDIGAPVESLRLTNYHDDDDHNPHVGALSSHIVASEAKARAIWRRAETPLSAPHSENALALDHWTFEGWHIRRRNDLKGRAFMIWITHDDALSMEWSNKMLVPNPNGESQVAFCLGPASPPYEIVSCVYDTLGPGDYAAIAKATLRHFLS